MSFLDRRYTMTSRLTPDEQDLLVERLHSLAKLPFAEGLDEALRVDGPGLDEALRVDGPGIRITSDDGPDANDPSDPLVA